MNINKRKKNIFFQVGAFSILSVSIFVYATTEKTMTAVDSRDSSIIKSQKKDSIASVEAFKKVYSVLMSPRCMNCHPSGDIPLQGDDSHIHNMLPERGVDGKGIATMQCITCHAAKGVPGENTPPGNPDWHLPPMNMKMVFQGKSARELAIQLVDPKKNGGKDMKALREHAEDGLVKGGWLMGGGRTLPPLSHEEFAKVWYTWIDNGAYAPAK
ncbi:hypothetical protein [Halpernia frigidisoli]|uniref:Cytochrome c domain-containing protein n=1 Tax=Halpernia frigidisoli TaxID=1125876 RepID=A0A1I3E545_9FLAO|nr:hypothetical protein [Halpernia frigidisoli]SFH94085.1 hypothetical protein SAMN05443292_0883 [Halpernia frigidisoli]